jgi:site-specific DNA-methyltransferase (adenine-specific)
MTHLSEDSRRLTITFHSVQNNRELLNVIHGFEDVCFLRLPVPDEENRKSSLEGVGELVAEVGKRLARSATLVIFGDTVDLVHVHQAVSSTLHYQLWVAIKREPSIYSPTNTRLPEHHIGALVYSRYEGQLQHTKTRIGYSYCPACNKTTKDYGGKKHTYHHYGTLISDVWRDIAVDPNSDIQVVLERFADLFGVERYREMQVYDLSAILTRRRNAPKPGQEFAPQIHIPESVLLNGDCLAELRGLPDNSIDLAFADPPYNLKKEYRGYADDLNIRDYFKWCDAWISEVARVLRPGRTFALLNIPLWAIRHFLYLEKVLEFQNWIAWDALSFPVRMIMPAHYAILCFSKGESRPLPGLTGRAGDVDLPNGTLASKPLAPLGEGYCLRWQCVSKRLRAGVKDRGLLSDVWWDIHRLKHNSRRVDHPCQLPPQLLYRLIVLFTEPGETVLDCFNGAGTTTLAAHQLGRQYVGIELEPQYHQLAIERHREIDQGLDPFRKEERELTAKNSPVARLKKQKYEIPKKTLQLEVRRVAQLLGRLPTRTDMIEYGQYPIRYYDEYFVSWGEVCAAARTTGMSETREGTQAGVKSSQPRLF